MIGAPLFIAQIGLDRIQHTLNEGKRDKLEVIKLSDYGTVGEIVDILAEAPPSLVLKLLNKKTGSARASRGGRRLRLCTNVGVAG